MRTFSVVRKMGIAIAFLCAQFVANTAFAQSDVTPPQGYIGFTRVFPGPPPEYWNGTQRGHYAFQYQFELGNTSGGLAGTFWSNSIRFRNSAADLPPNHVGGSQGGYLGVQVKKIDRHVYLIVGLDQQLIPPKFRKSSRVTLMP